MPQWYLYMVRCRTGTLYTGIAIDVSRRLEEHRKNGRKGAKYLRGRGPLELVLKSLIGSRGLALMVEDRIKKLPKSRKEQLVEHSRNCEINWGR
ncbi:MAG: GIY-YIG nuclease family protein [Acidobacteria bacterium]|nr:GIY-YIG nuclease family protein [Acidobacteriota bacterium]